jgi:Ulp1 protease family, C-terminal catalytic domain
MFASVDSLPIIQTEEQLELLVAQRKPFFEQAFGKIDEWVYQIIKCPLQTNTRDCGLLMCKNLHLILKKGGVNEEISYEWSDRLAERERKNFLL